MSESGPDYVIDRDGIRWEKRPSLGGPYNWYHRTDADNLTYYIGIEGVTFERKAPDTDDEETS